jgi:AAA domain
LTLKRSGFALCVWGEAGIGKTHLMQQVLDKLHFLQLRFHGTTPLAQVVVSLPRQTTSQYYLQLLGALESGQELEENRLVDLAAALLCSLAPVLLYIEDIHEASQAGQQTWQTLATFAKRCKGVGVVATSREQPAAPFEAQQLHTLQKSELVGLLEQKLQAPLPPAAKDWFFERTQGHPLFALEFLRHTMQHGYLWFDSQHWQWRTPTDQHLPITVEVLIGQQLEQVTAHPDSAVTLYSKAFLPRNCTCQIWQAVANLSSEQFAQAKLELLRVGMLHNDQFSHPLFAELALRKMPETTRRDLARRAVRFYQTNQHLPALLLAAKLPPEAELEYWQNAIDHSLGQHNHTQAARFVLAALPLFPAKQGQALTRTVAHLVLEDNLELANQLFSQLSGDVAAHAGDVSAHAADVFAHARVLAQIGQLETATSLLESVKHSHDWLEQMVLVHSLGEDPHAAAQLLQAHPGLKKSHNHAMLIALTQSLTSLSQFESAKQILEQAMSVASSKAQIAQTLVARARLNHYIGGDLVQSDLTQALEYHQAEKNLGGMAAVHHRLGILAYYGGQPSIAIRAFEQTLALYAQLGHQQYWIIKCMLHATQTELGEYSKAEAGLLETDAVMTRLSLTSWRVEICNNLSYLYRHWDIPYGATLARKFAQQGLEIARSMQNPRLECNCLYHLSKSQTQAGQSDLGLQTAQACLELADKLEYPAMQNYGLHARYTALRALGRLEPALADLRQVEAIMRHNQAFSDADFYRVQLEMEEQRPNQAKLYLGRLQQAGTVVFAQAALRLYPELADLPSNSDRRKSCLQVLGGMAIDGKPIGGRKRQELLFLLAEARLAGRSEVSKLDLLDALYAGEDDSLSAGALRKTIHQVRHLLGQDYIITTTNGYALGALETDAEQFLDCKDTALWRGVYGAGLGIKFDENVRDRLHEALFLQTQMRHENNPSQAIRLLKIILESDPYHLESLRLWMQVLVKNKNYKTLNRLYSDTKKRLLEIGESSPDHWSEFLENGKNHAI